jgi:hypothetical protein
MVPVLLWARVIREMNSEQRVQEVVASPLGATGVSTNILRCFLARSDGGGRISPRIKSGRLETLPEDSGLELQAH